MAEDDERTVVLRRKGRVEIGTRLNGIYQVDSLIGFGGMSEIYKGHNIQTHDEVAIKVILPEFANDEQMVSLFRREALILNRLSHEAIIRYHVFSHDPAADLLYLSMEFVNGPTLRERIKTRPLSQMEACQLISKVALGMQAAHNEGVVHRDLATDNIILSNGDITRPKIIDFGIARSGEGNDATLIQSGFAGKYSFSSPEQLGLYSDKVGPASDIYSLGLVFAAALLGRPLDMGGSHAQVVMKRQSVPDIAQINPGVKPIIEQMLQPNPLLRPQSMLEVAQLLQPFAGRETATRPDVVARPLAGSRRPEPRRGGGLMGSALTLVILAALGGGGWWASQNTKIGKDMLARVIPPPAEEKIAKAEPAKRTPSGKSEFKAPADAGTQTDNTAAAQPAPQPQSTPAVSQEAIAPPSAPPAQEQPSQDTADAPMEDDMEPAEGEAPRVNAHPLQAGDAEIKQLAPPVAQPTESPPTDAEPQATPSQTANSAEPAIPLQPERKRPGISIGEEGEPAAQGQDRVAMAAPDDAANPAAAPAATSSAAPAIDPAQWIASFHGGPCFMARPLRIASNSISIEGFGTVAEPFEDLEKRFRSAFGFDPDIGVRQIGDKQCPVIDLASSAAARAAAIDVHIPDDLLEAGEALDATVTGLPYKHVALFVVTAGGALVNVTAAAQASGRGVTLSIPASQLKSTGDSYLLLGVASDKPLDALDAERAETADAFVRTLNAEAAEQGAQIAAGVEYFRRAK